MLMKFLAPVTMAAVVVGSVSVGPSHAMRRDATTGLANVSSQLEEVAECVHRTSPPRLVDFYDSVFDVSDTTKSEPWIGTTTTMFGDMDGGMARAVISGVRAGIIKVPADHQDQLCHLLVLEAKSIRNVDGESLARYQADEAVGKRQARLLDSLRFEEVRAGSAVWIGDIIFDRLTNNLPVMDRLMRKLHRHGATLIMGNHENYYKPGGCTSSTWACLAWSRKDYPKSEFDALMDDVFVKAHYEPSNGLFYTHNGVRAAQGSDALTTAFGTLNGYGAMSPEQIAQWIRSQPIDHREFTNFRPSDAAMEYTELMAGADRIRQVHGHNSCFNVTYDWVVALNPRTGPRCRIYTAAAWTLRPSTK